MSSKAQRSREIKSDVLVVGIDVAKRRHVAAIRRPDGRKLRPFSFSNQRSGFMELVERAEKTKARLGCNSILFALEATGHYGHALRQFLDDRSYFLQAINPAHTKKFKELEDNSPEKSDPKDAGLVADLAAHGRGRRLVIPRGAFAELRRLGKLRQRLVVRRTRLSNRYHGLVDLVFPELSGLVNDVACRSLRRLFTSYPTADEIAALDPVELGARLRSWSRGHIGPERSAKIHVMAHETVGVREGRIAVRLEMRQVLRALNQVEDELGEVEQEQKAALSRVPYADLLLTVPGLGTVTAATILGETGDLRQYRNADAVIKFAGFNLYRIASGSFKGKTRITKRGRPLLRQQLFLAALRMSRQEQPLANFHNRLRARKSGPETAVAGCRKLLRLLFALVRDQACYEPGLLGTCDSEYEAA